MSSDSELREAQIELTEAMWKKALADGDAVKAVRLMRSSETLLFSYRLSEVMRHRQQDYDTIRRANSVRRIRTGVRPS